MERQKGHFIDVGTAADGWTLVSGPCDHDQDSEHTQPRDHDHDHDHDREVPIMITRVLKEDGTLLCCVVWGAIHADLCALGRDAYTEAGKSTRYVSTNRGAAAGSVHRIGAKKYGRSAAAHSGVVGYIDSANHKRPCRLTAYSKNHFEQYERGLPFIREIDRCFREHVPDAHRVQRAAALKTAYRIGDTAFSTVTVNYNFRTALHKDEGDFRGGFGNLVVLHSDTDRDRDRDGHGGNGGMLLFPQYKVAVQLGTGDFMAMDVHEWHCNSPLNTRTDRLSLVCYLRDNMDKCETINRRLSEIKGPNPGVSDCRAWDTDKLVRSIVGDAPTKRLTGTGPPPGNVQWWTLTSADERFHLEYKNKRYVLQDRLTGRKVHNLLPAWEYCKHLLESRET